MAASAGLDADFASLAPKCESVIQRQSSFDLPLVHHFMEHRVFHFGPGLVPNVGTADRDRDGLTGPHVHAVFAEASFHSSGEAKGDCLESAFEMPLVKPTVSLGQRMENSKIAGAGALDFGLTGRGRCIEVDWEAEKLVLQRSFEWPGKPRAQEADDGFEHPVRGHRVPLVNAKRTVTPREHDGTVGMQLEIPDPTESQGLETATQQGFRRYHFTRTR